MAIYLGNKKVQIHSGLVKGSSGGAEPVEMVIEPNYIEENIRWSNDECDWIEDENCDKYEYWIEGMFGATVKVKTSLPDGSINFITDYEHDLYYEDQSNEFEVPITTNDGFELYLSCVRADGPPQVVVSFKGIVVEKEASHTGCFDGTISEYVDSKLTTLRGGAFAYCSNLTKVSLPNCITFTGGIGRTFYECNAIETLELPKLQTIEDGNYCFYGLEKVERIDFPELITIATNFGGTFWNWKNVKVINMPKLSGTSIGNYAFRYCNSLEALILGGDTLNPLTNTNALSNSNNATIYVPDNLVNAYKAADNWKTYTSRIKGISDLPEELR